jgi:hypothetical protein
MARILFAAHDPGGANMLVPVTGLARSRGHDAFFLAKGPAFDIWEKTGEKIVSPDLDAGVLEREVSRVAPDVLVTGTGFSDLEPTLWRVAKNMGVPSLAAIDTWVNLRQRFSMADGTEIQPEIISVVDQEMKEAIENEGWSTARLKIVGQPHLEARVGQITDSRKGRSANEPPVLVFFSEPRRQDDERVGKETGFDQFSVAKALLEAVEKVSSSLRIIIKPHPRDNEGEWQSWLLGRSKMPGVSLALAEDETDRLLAICDGVIGMTTMVLFEAALSEIPALSLQLERKCTLNPRLDALGGIKCVTASGDMKGAVASFVRTLERPRKADASYQAILGGAAVRLMVAIEEEI